jgi:hypothetical protein
MNKQGDEMFCNWQELNKLPVYSLDKVTYSLVDGFVDKSGLFIESLVIRRPTLLGWEEYLVPTTCVASISSEDGIYLNRSGEDLENFHLSMDFPQYEALNAVGVDIQDLRWDGRDYYSIKNLMQFKVRCLNGKVGQVSDLFFHPKSFTVHYYAISMPRAFTRKWSLITSKWLEKIDWAEKQIYLNVIKEMVKSGPLYKPEEHRGTDMTL